MRPRRRRRPPVAPAVAWSRSASRTSDALWDVDQRLLSIERQIEEWLEEHAPDAVAVERVFAQHNLRTVMGTAQVAGIAMVAAARRRIPVALHTPSEVKAAVTGNGRADKAQVQTMVAAPAAARRAPAAGRRRRRARPRRLPPVAARRERSARPQRAPGSLTAAQRAWATAEQAARRRG